MDTKPFAYHGGVNSGVFFLSSGEILLRGRLGMRSKCSLPVYDAVAIRNNLTQQLCIDLSQRHRDMVEVAL